MNRSSRLAVSFGLLLLAALFAVGLTDLSRQSRLVPLAVLVPTLALLALQAAIDAFPTRALTLRRHLVGLAPRLERFTFTASDEAADASTPSNVVNALALPIALATATALLGLRWGIPIACCLWLGASGRAAWSRALLFSALLGTAIWLVFERGFGISAF